MQHFTSFFLKIESNLLVKRGFFLLNAAFAVAILNLISRGHFSLLVIYPNILNIPDSSVFAVDYNLYWRCLHRDSNYFFFFKLMFILLYKSYRKSQESADVRARKSVSFINSDKPQKRIGNIFLFGIRIVCMDLKKKFLAPQQCQNTGLEGLFHQNLQDVRIFHDNHYPRKWIDRSEWPPSSPDLTFLIFMLRKFVKDIAYVFPMLDNAEGFKIRI